MQYSRILPCHILNHNLKIFLDVRGPSGLLEYTGRGTFAIKADKKAEPKMVSISNECYCSTISQWLAYIKYIHSFVFVKKVVFV